MTDIVRGTAVSGSATVVGPTGSTVAYAYVSAYGDGHFTISGLSAGTYYLMASPDSGYLAQYFGGQPCGLTCPSVPAGTPIQVSLGATASGIDLALTRVGSVSGRVTNSQDGLPVERATVRIYSIDGTQVGSTSTDAIGRYQTTAALATGSYLLDAQATGYTASLYRDVVCGTSCPPVTAGVAVSVANGSATAGIDFRLTPAGGIRGVVQDAETHLPIAGITVKLFDAAGKPVSTILTNGAGEWWTTTTLASGRYFVATSNVAGYVDQLYGGRFCARASCDATQGTAVVVTAPSIRSGIDFALARGGSISGIVVTQGTGAAVASAEVHVYAADGRSIGWVTGNTQGVYSWTGLPAGTYYVAADAPVSYIGQLYSAADCPGFACTVTAGTPVSVTVGQVTSGVDFSLRGGGRIAGTTTSGTTQIPNVDVLVFDQAGRQVATGYPNSNTGAYSTYAVLPTGTYYARTSLSSVYANQTYQGIDCDGGTCPAATTGTPIAVVEGETTSGIDFSLTKAGTIAGAVTAQAGQPLSGITVEIVSGDGTVKTSVSTGSDGSYATSANLPAGSYYVRTANAKGYVDRLYGRGECPGGACALTSGTAVSVTMGVATTGIDFVLAPGGTIGGTVTDVVTTSTLGAVTVSVFDAAGQRVGTGVTNGLGAYAIATGLPSGSYFIRTMQASGHVDALYSGLACVSCDVTTGTPVTVSSPVVTTGIDFALTPEKPVFTDDPLRPGTAIRRAHLVELRTALDMLRKRHGLEPMAWTDPVLVPGMTSVRAVHFNELRTALDEVYGTSGHEVPTWPTPIVDPGGVVTASWIVSLRAAVTAIW